MLNLISIKNTKNGFFSGKEKIRVKVFLCCGGGGAEKLKKMFIIIMCIHVSVINIWIINMCDSISLFNAYEKLGFFF